MNHVRYGLLVVLAVSVAIPATGYATSFSGYQAAFLEESARQESVERDIPAARHFTKLAQSVRASGVGLYLG